jgi:hypothetical protein
VGEDLVDLGNRLEHARLHARGHLMGVLEREGARQLEMERELAAAVHERDLHVVDLPHAAHGERRARDPLAQGARAREGLDVDDHVALGHGACDGALDGVGHGVALAERRVRAHSDDHVDEVAPGGLAHAHASNLHGGLRLGDRGAHRQLGLRRGAVHEHLDVAAHQPDGRRHHEPGHEERGQGVGLGVARARQHEADEHRARAEEVGGEVEGVRGERGAAVAP